MPKTRLLSPILLVRTMFGLCLGLMACSCLQQTTKVNLRNENSSRNIGTQSGLLIENAPNHGVGYTDSLGKRFNLRYIPITITNDSVIPIQLQLAFSQEYDYPTGYDVQLFLFPIEAKPGEITFDSLTYELSDNALHDFFDRGMRPVHKLNQTLQPGEKCITAIGTLYPRPPKTAAFLPNALFVHTEPDVYAACNRLIDKDPSGEHPVSLGLKLIFRENCVIIPCGQISYPDQ